VTHRSFYIDPTIRQRLAKSMNDSVDAAMYSVLTGGCKKSETISSIAHEAYQGIVIEGECERINEPE